MKKEKKYAASEIAIAVIGQKVLDSYDGIMECWHFNKYPDLKVCIRQKKQYGYAILKSIDNNIDYYYWDSLEATNKPLYGYELPLTDYIECKLSDTFTLDELLEIQKRINDEETIEDERNVFQLLEKIYFSMVKDITIFENNRTEYHEYAKKVFDSLLILSQYKNEKEVKPRYNELIEEGIMLYHKVNRQSNIKEEKLQRTRK